MPQRLPGLRQSAEATHAKAVEEPGPPAPLLVPRSTHAMTPGHSHRRRRVHDDGEFRIETVEFRKQFAEGHFHKVTRAR
jgi:hypothetical protein